MSSSINVYAVSLEDLKPAAGSGDHALIDGATRSREWFLSTIDDIDDEAPIPCAQALADIVSGRVTEDAPGYLYGYALEAICGHVGRELPNICGIAGSTQWMEEVDAALKRRGVAVQLSDLLYRGSPVPIPEPDDFPFIGYWTPDEITTALAAIRGGDRSGLDNEMAEMFREIEGWLAGASESPGAAIVGFLS